MIKNYLKINKPSNKVICKAALQHNTALHSYLIYLFIANNNNNNSKNNYKRLGVLPRKISNELMKIN